MAGHGYPFNTSILPPSPLPPPPQKKNKPKTLKIFSSNHALQDDYKEEYTVNQFRWGPGDADFKYFEFVNPYSQQLCYWVVEEDDIVVRTQEDVSNKKLDVHVFFTQEVADCD